MKLHDVIIWDSDSLSVNDTVAYKHPTRDFNDKTEVVVQPSQVAVFVSEGSYVETLGEGRHVLDVAKLPWITKFMNKLVRGGQNPYTATIYFVNKVYMTDLKFGTIHPILMKDPVEKCQMHVKAFGQFAAHIENVKAKEFLDKILGTRPVWTKNEIADFLRARIVSSFTTFLGEIISGEKVSILDIAGHYDSLGQKLTEKMAPIFADYGVTIDSFALESINVPDSDMQLANTLRMKRQERELEIEAKRAEREMEIETKKAEYEAMGRDYYQMETQRQVLTAAAQNEGTAGSFMGAGMGLGMGVGMGGAFGAGMAGMTQNAFQQQPMMSAPMTPPPIQQVSFHIAVNGQTYGPYDMNGLSQMVASGSLTKDNLVWKPGMASWMQAGMVPELQQLFSVPPMPGNTPPAPPVPPAL